jgi:hypothetical protein
MTRKRRTAPDATGKVIPALRQGNKTARRAARILIRLKLGYITPTAAQKKKIVIAFAKRGCVVYGKAYDIVKIRDGAKVDLDNQESIERGLGSLVLYEIKSTSKKAIGREFDKYFFALTTAELLVAQSLKAQFKFVFVNVVSGHHKELTLRQVLAKARGFYPQWSILF